MPNFVALALIIAKNSKLKRIDKQPGGHDTIYVVCGVWHAFFCLLHSFALHTFAFSTVEKYKTTNIRLENTPNR